MKTIKPLLLLLCVAGSMCAGSLDNIPGLDSAAQVVTKTTAADGTVTADVGYTTIGGTGLSTTTNGQTLVLAPSTTPYVTVGGANTSTTTNGNTITIAATASSGGASEGSYVDMDYVQSFPKNAETKVLFTNSFALTTGAKTGYETNNSLIRVYATGKYTLHGYGMVNCSADPGGSAIAQIRVCTNGGICASSTFGFSSTTYASMGGPVVAPLVSLTSNSIVTLQVNHNVATGSYTNSFYPGERNHLGVIYVGP